MKKLIVIALAVMMIFAFTACSGNNGGVQTASLGDWTDASTIASQRAVTTKDGDTITGNAFDATKKYGGQAADVTMTENSESWTVTTTVTLPENPAAGMSVGLWTDSDYSTENQYRTDAILQAFYEKDAWAWKYYNEDGSPTGQDSQWITFSGTVPATENDEYKLEIAYANGRFAYSINDVTVGTSASVSVDNSRLQSIFLMIGGTEGQTVSAKFTQPEVTYISAATAE